MVELLPYFFNCILTVIIKLGTTVRSWRPPLAAVKQRVRIRKNCSGKPPSRTHPQMKLRLLKLKKKVGKKFQIRKIQRLDKSDRQRYFRFDH